MGDLALIADALAECEALGELAVLATVVRTEGSTYRRAGGDLARGLGLGCNGRVDVLLEPLAGDALARARVTRGAATSPRPPC